MGSLLIPAPLRTPPPECGTLCCRLWRMEALLHAVRSSLCEEKTLRTTSGRAGAAVGASRASRTPECGKNPLKEIIVIPNP